MSNPAFQKILFVAYYFPPVGGGGVQRSAKFVKYLPSQGWLPCVLTVKEPYDFYNDDTLWQDIPSFVPIYRSSSVEPMKWVRKMIIKFWKKEISKGIAKNKKKPSIKHPYLVKIKQYLFFPDNEIFWLPFAVWYGLKIIKKEKPQIIFSTASPFSAHLIALLLARISHLPWVADFRDFWVDRSNFPPLKWRYFIDRKLERKVCQNANHLVTVSNFIGERFKELYPFISYTAIPNGYDENDFLDSEDIEPHPARFTITYTGIFNQEQNPDKFFQAVNILTAEQNEFREKVRLRFIGQLDNPGEFHNYLRLLELGLDQYSDIIPYQPHRQVIQEMRKATVLLLFIGEYRLNQAILTGKIFEYLRARRPVLAVVPIDGAAADIIRQSKAGLVVANNDPAEIARGLFKLFNLYQRNLLEKTYSWQDIEKFERRELTRSLAALFQRIVKEV